MTINETVTEIKQVEPKLSYKVNLGATALPLDVETDLQKYQTIYVTKEIDPFRLVCGCEQLNQDYRVYGETSEGDKKILFTASVHFDCCNCCDQCLIGDYCCAYVCCDSIIFQMDYRRNGIPFYTQGFNLTKGCHCCDICVCCGMCRFCPCPVNKLYLRENIDPDSVDHKVGRKKGTTETNCCCACNDKFAEYTNENNVKGQTVRAACCDVWRNNCLNLTAIYCACCLGACCCAYFITGCDLEMSIENENGIKTGNVKVYSGCCSEKAEGKFCYFPRGYFEVNMPPGISSEQKFQIIADVIHLDLINKIL